MKKNILLIIGLIAVIVVVALAITLFQNQLPNWRNKFSPPLGMGGSLTESFAARVQSLPAGKKFDSVAAPSAALDNSLPRKITKNGSLDILVETAEVTVTNIQAIAGSMSGYVSDTNLYEVSPGVKSGYITIRIPAEKFEEAINRIKELAIKVERENVNANDVTEQFIDLEARLKNLKAQEDQYLDILKKADRVEDVLNVTNQLNQVRQQIDSWEGQLKYLNSQVDLSTITVNLTAEKEVQIFGLHWRPLTVIKQAVRGLLNSLVNYVNILIAVLIYLPVIILWLATILLIVWLVWFVIKKWQSHTKTKKKVKKDPK